MAEAADAGGPAGLPPLDDYTKGLITAIVSGTRAANALPQGSDYAYYRTDSGFRHRMSKFGKRVSKLVETLAAREKPLEDAGADNDRDDDDRMGDVVDACDVVLERVDAALDQVRGAASGNVFESKSSVLAAQFTPPSSSGVKRARLVHATNIRRPQLDFKEKPDNSADPFAPLLQDKPHSTVPLAEALHRDGDEGAFPHPYEAELQALQVPEPQLQRRTVRPHRKMEETSVQWVEGPEELDALLTKLRGCTEIAIDLEAHSYRSYQGFLCLMQLTTEEHGDFLIDTLKLRSELHTLNAVFADPKIVKVLHGADMDIKWLQRDLGLYIVNMFDTGQAMRVLNFPRFSLSYLLKHFCKVDTNKTYQLADWRIRPLSSDMLAYARADTHYLLHIFDLLTNQLLDQGNETANLLRAVYNQSKLVCLVRYEKPAYDEQRATDLYNRHHRPLSAAQLLVFKALHAWRDVIARSEDESLKYVMPDHMLFELAYVSPREATQVLACCQPVPPLVRLNAHNLVELINRAKLTAQQEKLKPAPSNPVPAAPASIAMDMVGDTNLRALNAPAMSTTELYESAAWVAAPADVSSIARMYLQTEDESGFQQQPETRKTLEEVEASFATSTFVRRLMSTGTSADPAAGPVEAMDADVGEAPKPLKEDQGVEAGEVPESYSQIYRLSNMNRKRNKEKKKMRVREEGAGAGISPLTAFQNNDPPGMDTLESGAFMANLGWVPRSGDGQEGHAPGDFDYSKAGPGVLESKQGPGMSSFAGYDQPEARQPRSHVAPRSGPRSMTFQTK